MVEQVKADRSETNTSAKDNIKKLQEEKVQLEQRIQELQSAQPPEVTTTAVSADNEAALVCAPLIDVRADCLH